MAEGLPKMMYLKYRLYMEYLKKLSFFFSGKSQPDGVRFSRGIVKKGKQSSSVIVIKETTLERADF